MDEQNWGAVDAVEWIAVPSPEADKYSRGVLGVVTGSATYPGAAVLGVEAAVRTGVGMVRYLGDRRAEDFVLGRRPEVVTAAGRVQAWLIGSGQDADSRDEQTSAHLHDAITDAVPMVIDAGALDLVPDTASPVILTPHFRELERLLARTEVQASLEQIAAEPLKWARSAARTLGVTVLLKGNTTHVVAPDGTALAVSLAPSWLATAGSGDVLAGILGALVATHSREIAHDGHAALVRLGATAAAVHGLAAQRASGGGPIAAFDVADAVPATIATLLKPPSAH